MKNLIYVFGLCLSLLFVTSCGSNLSKVSRDAEGFEKIQQALISKFGADAYYDKMYIGDDGQGKLTISFNVTNNPEVLKLEGWNYNQYNGWQQTSEITIEMENGADLKEFLFQLKDGGKFDLKKVGELVTASAKKLADEKNLKNAVMKSAWIHTFDKPVSDEDTQIWVYMQPENGGTEFTFRYDLAGNLVDFSY